MHTVTACIPRQSNVADRTEIGFHIAPHICVVYMSIRISTFYQNLSEFIRILQLQQCFAKWFYVQFPFSFSIKLFIIIYTIYQNLWIIHYTSYNRQHTTRLTIKVSECAPEYRAPLARPKGARKIFVTPRGVNLIKAVCQILQKWELI